MQTKNESMSDDNKLELERIERILEDEWKTADDSLKEMRLRVKALQKKCENISVYPANPSKQTRTLEPSENMKIFLE